MITVYALPYTTNPVTIDFNGYTVNAATNAVAITFPYPDMMSWGNSVSYFTFSNLQSPDLIGGTNVYNGATDGRLSGHVSVTLNDCSVGGMSLTSAYPSESTVKSNNIAVTATNCDLGNVNLISGQFGGVSGSVILTIDGTQTNANQITLTSGGTSGSAASGAVTLQKSTTGGIHGSYNLG